MQIPKSCWDKWHNEKPLIGTINKYLEIHKPTYTLITKCNN